MGHIPTAEESARYILIIFVENFACRPGHVLQFKNLVLSFMDPPWQNSDLTDGLNYAADEGWIEIQRSGHSFKLTESGFDAAGDRPMVIFDQCNEDVTIERKDGSRSENVRSLITAKVALIADAKIPLSEGDAILRKLPSGLTERLIVVDTGFFAGMHGVPAHYQVKYRLDGKKPEGSPGYTIHMSGNNPRVNINSTDNSNNAVSFINENSDELAVELGRLREALLAEAAGPEHYIAIGQISSAEMSAKEGDGSKVRELLGALGSAGAWTLGIAKEIGVQVAAAAITQSLNL